MEDPQRLSHGVRVKPQAKGGRKMWLCMMSTDEDIVYAYVKA